MNKKNIILWSLVAALILAVLAFCIFRAVSAGESAAQGEGQSQNAQGENKGSALAGDSTAGSAGASQSAASDAPYAEEQTVVNNREDFTQGETAATQGVTPNTAATVPESTPNGPKAISYGEYLEMTPAQQQAYFLQFTDPQDYIAWLSSAKEAYEATKDSVIATGDVTLPG